MWPFDTPYPVVSAEEIGEKVGGPPNPASEFDYIVIGGGTAGGVVANRLSEDPDVKVLVLERGDIHPGWASRVPLMTMPAAHNPATWVSTATLPMPRILSGADRSVYRTSAGVMDHSVITSATLGGLSRINGTIYTRGLKEEYDNWNIPGWSYEELDGYFKKSEGQIDVTVSAATHGLTGPWKTRLQNSGILNVTTQLVEAARTFGLSVLDDGVTASLPSPTTIMRPNVTIDAKGQRCSAFDAFLSRETVLERKSCLSICVKATVQEIELGNTAGGGLVAQGVILNSSDGNSYRVRANREVILCAGTISSPQIMQLSGIGPREHLESVGIEVKKENAGVGSFLKDHCGVYLTYAIPLKDSLTSYMVKNTWSLLYNLLLWFLFGTGAFCNSLSQLLAFARSDHLSDTGDILKTEKGAKSGIPDIELQPMAALCVATDDVVFDNPETEGVYSFIVNHLQPASSGSVRLASKNPADAPAVHLGYLSEVSDYTALRKGIRLVCRIVEEMRNVRGYMITPYDAPRNPEEETDEKIDEFIHSHLRTTYHYSSTCRMGKEEDGGVVDSELRVHGVDRLRIADCSILPDILACHLQAPAVMIGEKCADLVKQEWAQKRR